MHTHWKATGWMLVNPKTTSEVGAFRTTLSLQSFGVTARCRLMAQRAFGYQADAHSLASEHSCPKCALPHSCSRDMMSSRFVLTLHGTC